MSCELLLGHQWRSWDRIYGSHPDHLAVAEATMAAVYPDSRNPHAHPELLADGLEPHAVPEVWVIGLQPLDVFIDVTDVMDIKVAALSSHASQVGWCDPAELVPTWAADVAAANDLPQGRLAEVFRRIDTK